MLIDYIVASGVLALIAKEIAGCDLSLQKNKKGAYDVVARWSKQPGKAEIQKVRSDIEAQIKQRYAYEKVKQELAKKGFILAKEEVQPDNTKVGGAEMVGGKQELEITISPDGEVLVDVKGVKGKKCADLVKFLEVALGEAKDRKFKPDYYEREGYVSDSVSTGDK